MKVFRLRRLNAAGAGANKASDLQNRVKRVVQREQRELRRRQVSRVHRRGSKSRVASQRDDPVRSQVPGRVGQGKFRRRVKSENLSVSGSARRRLPVQANLISAAEVRRPDFVNRSRPRLVADLQVKRAVKEKECRAPMVSRPRNNNSSRRSSRSSGSTVARLQEPITARDKGSRKVARREKQKKRHRQDHDRTSN